MMSSAKFLRASVSSNYRQGIVSALDIAFEVKVLWHDGELGTAGNVDCPDAIEIVEIVARIVEAGGSDERVVGCDGSTAFDNGIGVFGIRGLAWSFVWSIFCGCNR